MKQPKKGTQKTEKRMRKKNNKELDEKRTKIIVY